LKIGRILHWRALVASILLSVSWAGKAGQSASGFSVGVTLRPAGLANSAVATVDTCTSQIASQQTNATVTVVCATGQFVSIAPTPGRPFLGTHGGAFKYSFRPTTAPNGLSAHGRSFDAGSGTVTGLQIYTSAQTAGQLEMLISF
jgi:hypothetical protein